MKRFATVMLLFFALSMSASAQDLRRLEPQTPEPLSVPAPVLATPSEPAGRNLILPNLRGIVFLSHPDQMQEQPNLLGRMNTRQVPFLDTAEFAELMSEWWSHPITDRGIQDLVTAVGGYYAEHDRPFVSVSMPAQNVSDGVLQLLVVEGVLSAVDITGNEWFDDDYYRRNMDLPMGDIIRLSELESGLEWLAHSNPAHAATVIATPGDGFGATAIELQVRERKPLRLYAGANNQGTATTGKQRLVFGANWGRAFGRNHQMSAQLSASPDFHRSLGLSGNYRIPLAQWRHVFELSAAWSRINADMPEPFNSEGESWQVLTHYQIPLRRFARLQHKLNLGFDFKRSDNNLEFGGLPVTDNLTDIMQWSLGWQGAVNDSLGRTSVGANLVYAPGDLSTKNDDDAFEVSRWGASSDYVYGRIDLQRYTRLPAKFAWQATAVWQQSDGNLLGSEQLGLVGSAGVRGYRESDLYADEGILLRNQLFLPALSLMQPGFHTGQESDSLQLHLFYDYGRGNSVNPLPDEMTHLSISSIGIGANYQLGQSLSASFEYGWQQKGILSGRSSHAHLSVMMSY